MKGYLRYSATDKSGSRKRTYRFGGRDYRLTESRRKACDRNCGVTDTVGKKEEDEEEGTLISTNLR